MEDLFTEAYRKGVWHYGHIDALKGVEHETASGPGSTLRYTEPLRAMLPALLQTLAVRTLFDAPCGDLNWIRAVPLPGIRYIGADIVGEIVQHLQGVYRDRELRHLDITRDALPEADLWLCRDVLLHLSDDRIRMVLRNWLRSGIRYFATTHYARKADMPDYFDLRDVVDLDSSPFTLRFVNLTNPPFNFPPPAYVLKDYIEGFTPRWLAVFDRQAMPDIDL